MEDYSSILASLTWLISIGISFEADVGGEIAAPLLVSRSCLLHFERQQYNPNLCLSYSRYAGCLILTP
ncbi:hypothetical protein KY284_005035 [Solanum tuberosum]|nr:hypothetical protein KY284_005035 [Solanum tuberosum]